MTQCTRCSIDSQYDNAARRMLSCMLQDESWHWVCACIAYGPDALCLSSAEGTGGGWHLGQSRYTYIGTPKWLWCFIWQVQCHQHFRSLESTSTSTVTLSAWLCNYWCLPAKAIGCGFQLAPTMLWSEPISETCSSNSLDETSYLVSFANQFQQMVVRSLKMCNLIMLAILHLVLTHFL